MVPPAPPAVSQTEEVVRLPRDTASLAKQYAGARWVSQAYKTSDDRQIMLPDKRVVDELIGRCTRVDPQKGIMRDCKNKAEILKARLVALVKRGNAEDVDSFDNAYRDLEEYVNSSGG